MHFFFTGATGFVIRCRGAKLLRYFKSLNLLWDFSRVEEAGGAQGNFGVL
jgi:hypothetical protein